MSGYNTFNLPQTGDHSPYGSPVGHRSSRRNRNSSISSNGSLSSFLSPGEGSWKNTDTKEGRSKRSSKRGVSTFISKLFSMVGERCNKHLISWNPSGASFLVCNATRFSQDILPGHFKHSNFSSFVRQLNMYGFHKINKSPRGQRGNNENEIWEFSHPSFQRGRPKLLENIKRKALDSEFLRRENGDIHDSLSMVQLSQTDLLHQYRLLQESFSNLQQDFNEMKKVQLQQQAIIKRLANCQGIPTSSSPLMNGFDSNQQNVFISSSTSSPLQSWEQQPNILMHPYSYNNNKENNISNNQSNFSFNINNDNTFTQSPLTNILLSSSSCEDPQPMNNFSNKHNLTKKETPLAH